MASKPPEKLEKSMLELWEERYKPEVLSYKKVPLKLVAEILGTTERNLYEMFRKGIFPFVEMFQNPDKNGNDAFWIYPLRFVAWYEGKNI